jgi:hypothetical protein
LLCRTHNRLMAEHDYGRTVDGQEVPSQSRLRCEGDKPPGVGPERLLFEP